MIVTRFYSRQAGFSFVDLWAGMIILVVGVTALAGVFLSESRLSVDNRDTAFLTAASRNVFVTLQSAEFATLTQNYGGGTSNPQFWVTTTGDIAFTDPGAASVSGTITFFADESSIPVSFASLGTSFDLNNNTTIDSIVTDYKILPTRITLTTNNPNPRTVTVESILYADRSW